MNKARLSKMDGRAFLYGKILAQSKNSPGGGCFEKAAISPLRESKPL
jgi:hypothetical protein